MTTSHINQALTIETADENYLADLHNRANQLLHSGYSVIPIKGDLQNSDSAKQPTISWKRYQTALAQAVDTREWFLNRGDGGLGIVLGQISGNLVVAECDTPEWNARFEADLHDLLNTRTVLSAGRKLPHRYYRLPDGYPLHFRGEAGAAELRGEGQYVITSPTCINGSTYELIRGGEPKQLTNEETNRLFAFYDDNFGMTYEDIQEFETILIGDSKHLKSAFFRQVNECKSRNKAAFKTLCWARDNGWSKTEARASLRDDFMHLAPNANHVPQTAGARGREFDATLNSVYNRPTKKRLSKGLPTLLRERFLQNGFMGLSRVLDCLIMSGWEQGKRFTEADAVAQCAKHGISLPTVHAALNTELSNLDVMGVPSNSKAFVFNAKDTRNFDYIQIRGKCMSSKEMGHEKSLAKRHFSPV